MHIPIIYYHSVAIRKNPNWIKNHLTLELQFFIDQIKYLSENGYESLFLDEYFEIISERQIRRKKYVCITFDDGFLDNWIFAFPVLKKYKFKATIFINPEFVDLKNSIRQTLEDYWNNKVGIEMLNKWGYLSWEEMVEMENSGLIDIQSHTMTHTKYFTSDRIFDFHHPGSHCIYVIGNLFPERKPYYVEDEGFEKLIPFGYPFFEEASAIIAKKVEINPNFISETIEALKKTDWLNNYNFNNLYKQIEPIYSEYKTKNNIILKRETIEEYNERINFELVESKKIIEKKLNKKVSYCCWPNHDYNDFVHTKAKEFGYLASVIELKNNESRPIDRFDRISIGTFHDNPFLSILKINFKLKSYQLLFPYYQLNKIYQSLK